MGQCSTLPSEGRQSSRREFTPIQNHNLPQGRNPDAMSDGPEPMEEDNMREDIPQPPAIATRTRCYKLNLDSNMFPPPSVFLGPYKDAPPPLTYSTSEDSAATYSPVQVAINTAKIFRGITVSKDGTILTQNARATRSNRGAKNKRGEKSRQATKIEKAKDLVEETIATGKAPDSDEPANMMSLVIMGEYDDMKYLVRDGSKKLREASELPDDSLLAINRVRDDMAKESSSPRKRGSPNGSIHRGQSTPSKSRPGTGFASGAPPKLKSHPRDRPSSRKDDKSRRDGMDLESERGDWGHALPVSFSRGIQNIWNCGATGEETGTISPTQVVSPRDGKPHAMGVHTAPHRPVFEGRDNHYSQARETGVSTRAN